MIIGAVPLPVAGVASCAAGDRLCTSRGGTDDPRLKPRTEQDDGDGFKITKSALTLNAKVEGISADEFATIAADAKANCPVSKVLNADITLDHTLA